MIQSGTRLGRYEILEALGAGGMGEVYRARDARLGRDVAVKVLPAKFAQDEKRLARFEREVKAVAALSHPNILALHDYQIEHGVAFAVMELLEGETLRQRLARSALPWREALEIAATIADGLAAAHARGIIHRDLKPANLFLTSAGVTKVLDFGLARFEPQPLLRDDTASHDSVLTDPGAVMGTVGYMSPEQVRGEVVDARSDLFSLGCVVYEMLSGRRPFARLTPAESLAAVLHDAPPALVVADAPPSVALLVENCLLKDVQNRFPAARDFAFACRGVLQGSTPPTLLTQAQNPARPRRSRKAIDSLAVLPLLNAGVDPATEYLSDGITESIINLLAPLPKVRVMARSTVFRYKGQAADPQEVGRALKVRAVLTGRLLQRGERLIIQVELVDVADGAQLWGEHYNRSVAEIFAVEEDIAREIAEKLRLRLSGDQKKRLTRRPTQNTEAYRLYLKARFHWNKRTEEGLKKAVQYLEEALALDPNYALAYAGLADCYNLPFITTLSPREAYPRAKAAAARALDLDPNLAEAHAALAVAQFAHDWDWPGAAQSFNRAIELNPHYARARHGHSSFLTVLGRFDEAIAEIRRAEELDPLSAVICKNVGTAYYFARRYDEAAAQFHKALELDANFAWTHYELGLTYCQKQMHTQAIAALEHARGLDEASLILAGLAVAFARSGERGRTLEVLEQLLQPQGRRPVAPYDIATVYVALDDADQAVNWLEKAYAERSLWLPLVRVDPLLDPLRSLPRFADLVARMHFPS